MSSDMKLQNGTISSSLYNVKMENMNTNHAFTRLVVVQEDTSFVTIARIAEEIQEKDENEDWMILAIEYVGLVDIYAK